MAGETVNNKGSTYTRVVIGTVRTPAGPFGAMFTSEGLARLTFQSESPQTCERWLHRWLPKARIIDDRTLLGTLEQQLTAYFEGRLREFTVPLDLRGTPFQLEVWKELVDVRYGEVRSYAYIATRIGRPRAVRAVGAANGANPVPIIVPCHRVIGSNGTLTGYGGGLMTKQGLLRLEGALTDAMSVSQPSLTLEMGP